VKASSRRVWSLVAVLASAVFFGLNATATKILYAPQTPSHVDPLGLIVARSLWTLPLFLVLAVATRPGLLSKPARRDVALFGLCGVAYGPGTTGMYALGVGATSAAHAVLLLSLVPPIAAVIAAALLHERLHAVRIAAIAIGVAGAATLTFSRSTSGSSPEGDAMILVMVVMWALMTLAIRVLTRTYPPLFVTGVMGTLGTAILIALGAALHRLDAGSIAIRFADPRTIIWFDLELVLLLSVTAQLLQSLALRVLTVGLVSALTAYGTIFVGLLASLFILHEQFTVWSALAIALLAAALTLALVPVPRVAEASG
jgi:drug/metabolite transporter (DMT)-like permease